MGNPKHLDIFRSNLSETWFMAANLSQTRLTRAHLNGAYLRSAKLKGADLTGAVLCGADLEKAILCGARLHSADFSRSNLTNADLRGSELIGTILVGTTLSGAKLSGAYVYGVSAWDIKGTPEEQLNLVITRNTTPVTVDELEVAQFLHLIMDNQKITKIFNTMTGKAVLILGRFTENRITLLESLKHSLSKMGYVPVIFNFKKPDAMDFTETIRTLAGLSRFVVADITKPRSVQQELNATVPDLEIPFLPIIRQGEKPYSMFNDIQRKDWVLKLVSYKSSENLLKNFHKLIIKAERLHKVLLTEKSRQAVAATPIDELTE